MKGKGGGGWEGKSFVLLGGISGSGKAKQQETKEDPKKGEWNFCFLPRGNQSEFSR